MSLLMHYMHLVTMRCNLNLRCIYFVNMIRPLLTYLIYILISACTVRAAGFPKNYHIPQTIRVHFDDYSRTVSYVRDLSSEDSSVEPGRFIVVNTQRPSEQFVHSSFGKRDTEDTPTHVSRDEPETTYVPPSASALQARLKAIEEQLGELEVPSGGLKRRFEFESSTVICEYTRKSLQEVQIQCYHEGPNQAQMIHAPEEVALPPNSDPFAFMRDVTSNLKRRPRIVRKI